MTEGKDKGLETLQVWQRALAFAIMICRQVLPMFPVEEKWALTNQLRRSAQSIPANIAEAYGRYYYKDSVRFCYIARGSLEETYSHITLAKELGYISPDTYTQMLKEIQELGRMLNGYITFLKRSKRGESEPGSASSIHEEQTLYFPDPDPFIPDP